MQPMTDVHATKAKMTTLSMADAFKRLGQHGIPCAPYRIFPPNQKLAAAALSGLRFPLVVKYDSPRIPHKTESGLVMLNCRSEEEAEKARILILDRVRQHHPDVTDGQILLQEMTTGVAEFLVGFHRDAVVGPVVMVGTGGIMVELFEDVAVRVLPCERHDIEEMLTELKGAALIRGFRGRSPGDEAALVDLVWKAACFFASNADVAALDMNPVIIQANGIVCVDALLEVSV